MMKVQTQTRGDFTFKKVGIDWVVYEVATGVRLGRTRANGSRLKSRSWTYTTLTGAEGRANSRRSAAESLRHAAKAV
jgi:hypothetical protein